MEVDLHACISGDKDAWDAFADRWAGLIHSAVGRVFKSHLGVVERADVEDTVQDVFVRLLKDDYRLLRNYDPGRASLSTWLTLVSRSVAIDRLRKRKPASVPLEGHEGLAVTATSGGAESLPLHLLSPRQRLVLRLLFDEERSVAQAAQFLGVDEQTIRSTKHKALSRLRKHFLASDRPPNPPQTQGDVAELKDV